MKRGENPAVTLVGDESPTSNSKHHPAVDWEQVPELLEKVSLNQLRQRLKADWDKAVIAELKKRPADDPLVNLMKHWSSEIA